MSDIWIEVTQDHIRGDRDGLVLLRSMISDALRRGHGEWQVEDERGDESMLKIERVGS
jgi:hypothetical protein